MSLNPAEISKLIKAQIQSIDQDLEMNESGTILTVGDGIATVYGLKNAMMSELLFIPSRCIWYGHELRRRTSRCRITR